MSYYVILKKTDMRMYIVLKDGEEINKIKNCDELIRYLISIDWKNISTIGCVSILDGCVISNVKVKVDDNFLSKENLEKIYDINNRWYYIFEKESLLDLPISSIPKKIHNYCEPKEQYIPYYPSSFNDPMHHNDGLFFR